MVTISWSPAHPCTLRRSSNDHILTEPWRTNAALQEVTPAKCAKEALAIRSKALSYQLAACQAENQVLRRQLDDTTASKDASIEQLLEQLDVAKTQAEGYRLIAEAASAREAEASAQVQALKVELDSLRRTSAADLRAASDCTAAAAAGAAQAAEELMAALRQRATASELARARAVEAEQLHAELDGLEQEVRRLLAANVRYAEQVQRLEAGRAAALAAQQQAEEQASASEDMVAALSQTILDFEMEVARLQAECAASRALADQQAAELAALECALDCERSSNSSWAASMAAELGSAQQELAAVSARHAATTAITAAIAQQQLEALRLATSPELAPSPRTPPPQLRLPEAEEPAAEPGACGISDACEYMWLHLLPSQDPDAALSELLGDSRSVLAGCACAAPEEGRQSPDTASAAASVVASSESLASCSASSLEMSSSPLSSSCLGECHGADVESWAASSAHLQLDCC